MGIRRLSIFHTMRRTVLGASSIWCRYQLAHCMDGRGSTSVLPSTISIWATSPASVSFSRDILVLAHGIEFRSKSTEFTRRCQLVLDSIQESIGRIYPPLLGADETTR